jgi:phosphoglycolate phosphatase
MPAAYTGVRLMCRFDAVVWDWNGTLLDDAQFCVGIINEMLTLRSLPGISVDFYKAVIEFPVILYYRKLGFDLREEEFETISDEFVSSYQAGWKRCTLQQGATDIMAALADAGVGQSVLSASKSSHLLEQLRHFGVDKRLISVTGADNHHGHGKLDIARSHAAMLSAEPRRTLFIGDTAHDAEAAAEAGCQCLLVSFGHYGYDRLKHLGLPVAQSMREVCSFICPCS